jgi:biopolymer transport protein ExbD
MSHEDQPRTSSSGTVIAIVAVVVLLMLGGLLVLGLAGLFLFGVSPRSVAPPPPQMVERVMVEPAQPVESHANQQVQAAVEAPSPGTDVRKLVVKVDAQGKILADGQTVDIAGLKNLLVKAREDGTIRLEVVVEVDRQCLFEHVAAVQAVCKQAGVENVRVQALTALAD